MTPLVRGLMYGAVILTVLMTVTAMATWFERKMAGRMQSRMGPTIVGPFGLLQPLADIIKLVQKEHIVPDRASPWLFALAPPLTVLFAVGTAAVVPFTADIIAADLDIGVLWVLAVGGLVVIPVWMAGWASNNKLALVGGMRAVAQSVSYEVPLVMAAMVPIVLTGSMSMKDIVAYQSVNHFWFAFYPMGLPAFVIFMGAMLAEANRIPFDIPEAESELVAGVSTEYTGVQFALFQTGEYAHTLIAAAVAAVLFLGGWDGPFGPGLHWMVLKTLALFVSVYFLRWTLLRFRSDQLMSICWKWLVPTSILLVMCAGLWVRFLGTWR